jgi:hypothetical protein
MRVRDEAVNAMSVVVPVSSNVNCPIRQLILMKEERKKRNEERKKKIFKLFDLRSCENKQL